MAVTFGCLLTPKIFGPMASPKAVQTLARRAEALGFDSVYVSVRATTARTMLSDGFGQGHRRRDGGGISSEWEGAVGQTIT